MKALSKPIFLSRGMLGLNHELSCLWTSCAVTSRVARLISDCQTCKIYKDQISCLKGLKYRQGPFFSPCFGCFFNILPETNSEFAPGPAPPVSRFGFSTFQRFQHPRCTASASCQAASKLLAAAASTFEGHKRAMPNGGANHFRGAGNHLCCCFFLLGFFF